MRLGACVAAARSGSRGVRDGGVRARPGAEHPCSGACPMPWWDGTIRRRQSSFRRNGAAARSRGAWSSFPSRSPGSPSPRAPVSSRDARSTWCRRRGHSLAQVTNGTSTARAPFTLSVGCLEGASSPCGVPDPAQGMCVGGSRVCLGGKLGVCTPDPGRPPYEADTGHCGGGCDETCPRTSSNRCVGTCACGSSTGPCSGATPACCPGTDGRPESFTLRLAPELRALRGVPDGLPDTTIHAEGLRQQQLHLRVRPGPPSTATAEESPPKGRTRTDARHAWSTTRENCGACGRRCPDALPAAKHASGGRACSSGRCAYTCDGRVAELHRGNGSKLFPDRRPRMIRTGARRTSPTRTPATGPSGVPVIANGYATCTPDRAPTDPAAAWSCGLKCDAGFDPDPCGAPPVCKPLSDAENCGVLWAGLPDDGHRHGAPVLLGDRPVLHPGLRPAPAAALRARDLPLGPSGRPGCRTLRADEGWS